MRSCPEELRLAVVDVVVTKTRRLPSPTAEAEAFAHRYVQSALERRHLSADSGEQLSAAHIALWEALFAKVPSDLRLTWQEDPVLARAREYFADQGHLSVPKGKSGDKSNDAALAAELSIVRKAIHRDQKDRQGRVLRRQLACQDVAAWEAAFPGVDLWLQARLRGGYIMGDCVFNRRSEEGEKLRERHLWPREPFLCKPCGCYLCGDDFDSKPQWVNDIAEYGSLF